MKLIDWSAQPHPQAAPALTDLGLVSRVETPPARCASCRALGSVVGASTTSSTTRIDVLQQ